MRYPILLGLAPLATTPVAAQAPQTAPAQPSPALTGPAQPVSAPACPVTPVPLPAGLEGWVVSDPVTAAVTPADLARAQIVIGQRADVQLAPAASVAYVVPPARPPGADTHGGMLGFTIQAPGTYRIALNAAAWIDVLHEGKPAVATAHGHGQPCSSIRKTLDFALTPGHYVLQVVGNAKPTLALMVAHAS